jgi:hypothetical protein
MLDHNENSMCGCPGQPIFAFNPPKLNMLSINGRDQTGYTVHAGFCMFPQSCDLRTETAGSL